MIKQAIELAEDLELNLMDRLLEDVDTEGYEELKLMDKVITELDVEPTNDEE